MREVFQSAPGSIAAACGADLVGGDLVGERGVDLGRFGARYWSASGLVAGRARRSAEAARARYR
jgi:hypothetical protein